MRRESARLALFAVVMLGLCGCERAPAPAATGPPLVVASFYPLWEFAARVAGDRAEVVSLVPPGVEPHDWEPSPQDVARVERARVFVVNGAGFETWAERLLSNVKSGTLVVVTATEGIELLPAPSNRASSSPHDPHVWMDPLLAQAQVERIRAGLVRALPAQAAVYAANAAAYTARLAELHVEFERGLADCARRDVVVSHAAFAYLSRRYGLLQVPLMGLSPEAEPSPAELARIVRFARQHRVQHIFFDTLVSPRLAATLAREIGADGLVLNPLEGLTRDEAARGADYFSVMRENLANLRRALGCR